MARISVLMCSEGTYPYTQGGVSVWCDQLIRGLPDFDFKIFAITNSPDAKPVYSLPLNVSGIRPVALWGTQELGYQEATFAEIYQRKARTTPVVVRKEFLENFYQAANCIVRSGPCPEQLAKALLDLHIYFKHFDFAKTMTSPEAWDVFLRVCERSFPDGQELTIHDVTTCMRWMQRFLGILAVPLPQADITHGSMSGLSSVPGVLNKFLTGAPFLLTEHGIYMRELYLSLMRVGQSNACRRFLLAFNEAIVRMNYHYADVVTALGTFNKSWQLELGATESKIRITPNGTDPEHFQSSSRRRKSKPLVLTMARVYRLKGIEFLVRAAAEVRSRFGPVTFRVLGEIVDQEYFHECKTFIDENGLEDTIEFSTTKNPGAALAEADVFCLPSISEGMPYCILEAMFSGLPVIATDVGNISEMLGGTGIVVPPADPEALAKAILSLLENPDTAYHHRLALGEAAQKRAHSLYTTKQAVGRFKEIYQSLLYERAIPEMHTAAAI
jgi:glycosyltransferase involved in cell wall biosynthesis